MTMRLNETNAKIVKVSMIKTRGSDYFSILFNSVLYQIASSTRKTAESLVQKALQIYVAERVLVALESRWEGLLASLLSRSHVMSMRCPSTTRLIAESVSCAIVLIILNGSVGVVEATARARATL